MVVLVFVKYLIAAQFNPLKYPPRFAVSGVNHALSDARGLFPMSIGPDFHPQS